MGRLSRGGLIALASLAIAGCHSEATDPVVAKDPATTATPTPAPTPTPVPTPPATTTTPPSDVDDHGTMHSKYGAPPPPHPTVKPVPTVKPAPTTTGPSMAPAYGGAPKPK